MLNINTPGEHLLFVEGDGVRLEAKWSIPNRLYDFGSQSCVALLGHPHSLHGGSFDNKVVTTLVRAFNTIGIPSLRVNFRGVGRSEGQYDAGVGESKDLIVIANTLKNENNGLRFFLAGFSFGSYVVYRTAAQVSPLGLITIAPTPHHYDFNEFKINAPWCLIQGDKDELISLSDTYELVKDSKAPIDLEIIPNASHFFHGKLIVLREMLVSKIYSMLPL